MPAISQTLRNSFSFQLSYGHSFFSSNSSPRYTFICPELKIGFGYVRTWNRFGLNAAVLAGMQMGTIKDLPYQTYVYEHRLYMLLLERRYSNVTEFIEMPVTIFYQVIEDRLSVHAGVTARRYFGNVPPLSFQGYFEGIPGDDYNIGIISMLNLKVSRYVNVSVDYSIGLTKLNATQSLNSQVEYFLKGNFAQVSLFLNSRILRLRTL